MAKMKNALIYVTNHKQLLAEEIDNALSEHYGVTHIQQSLTLRNKGLVFVDYECDKVSMEMIIQSVQKNGMTARVIGL